MEALDPLSIPMNVDDEDEDEETGDPSLSTQLIEGLEQEDVEIQVSFSEAPSSEPEVSHLAVMCRLSKFPCSLSCTIALRGPGGEAGPSWLHDQ